MRSSIRGGSGLATALAAVAIVAALAAPRTAWGNGACCGADAVCYESVTSTWCNQNGIHWWGNGSSCDDLPGGACENLGACCQRATPSSPGGSCTGAVTEAECRGLCGHWYRNQQCSSFLGETCASSFVNSPPLPADCNNNGVVAVNELVNAVQIALLGCTGQCCVEHVGHHYDGTFVCTRYAYIPPCPAADTNHDGIVFINELVQGVNAALGICN